MGIWRMVAAAALGLALLAAAPSAPAQEKPAEAAPKLAILIVGDEANAEMLREEKALIGEMTRLLQGGGEGSKFPQARTLQVYSYHFNQARERQYCEKKLNILAEDLLFVGLVELKDKLPRRVVYRLDRIARPRRAAEDILARAEEVLAPETATVELPEESPSPAASPGPAASSSPRPAVSPSPRPVASPSPSAAAPGLASPPRTMLSAGWTIQVGSFSALSNAQDLVARLKEKGHESRIEESSRNGASFYRVYAGSYPNRQEAQSALERLKADGFDKAFIAAPEEG